MATSDHAGDGAEITPPVRTLSKTRTAGGTGRLRERPLVTWVYHALAGKGVPAICIETRHAQKILNEIVNKMDANDAGGPCGDSGPSHARH